MEEKNRNRLIHSVLKSVLAALILTGLSLLLISVIYLNRDLSDDLARKLVTICAFSSVFAANVGTGIKMRCKGLLSGLLSGSFYALCLYVTGFLAFGFPQFSKGLLSTLVLSVLCGVAGGIVGVNIKGKRK